MRSTHHGPIVNAALGADEAEPLALAWTALRESTAFAGMLEVLDVDLGAGAGRELEGHTAPRLEHDLGRPRAARSATS